MQLNVIQAVVQETRLSVATVGLALSWASVQSGLQAVVQETRLSVATVGLALNMIRKKSS